MIVMLLVMLAGLLSAWLYWRARRRIESALVLAAALALAGLLGDFKTQAPPLRDVRIEPGAPVIDLRSAAGISVEGSGLSAARWRDLPARPLRWQEPRGGILSLQFPRSVPPGGVFTLQARINGRADRQVQLLAPNGQLLAQGRGRVQWTPPAAADLVLRARLLDDTGRMLAQGSVPLRVDAGAPLRVQGRFSAPSFDKRALRMLFESSHALLDWQVTLAPGVVRTDVPRTPMTGADLIVTDARWLERLDAGQRAALAERVAQGARLLVLGSGAPPPRSWSDWPFDDGQWRGNAELSMRSWGEGRIGWLGAADWHRQAISDPAALRNWWQGVLDRMDAARAEPVAWIEPEPMPLAGQRLEVCAYGARGRVSFPQLNQTLEWQRRLDRADASCVAVWPDRAGWLRAESGGSSMRIYVYAAHDWPAWQAALNREATRRYALRTPEPAAAREERLPAWPFAAAFALSMLGLWWRERGAPAAMPTATRDDPASSF